ncbi:MAG TPA: lytic murein transglycosylase B [Steroidobacteraceae bacterium]
MTDATRTLRAPFLALLLAAVAQPAWALDATREDVRAFTEEMKRKHGFEAEWLDGIIADAASQPRIIELMSKPAESVMAWHDYRDHFLTAERIDAGVAFWTEHRDEIAAVEKSTGVAAHAIVGILGAETFFGRITGRFRVVDALATLAFDYPPRGTYFRAELEQFLLLARDEKFDVATVQGSYAGAMGAAQFMPRSYRAYAVDGDGDGTKDLWGSWDDVIASVANYLAEHGWRAGEPVVAPASLWFPRADGLVEGSLAPNTTVKTLRDRGLSFDTTLGDKAPALFIRVDGDTGPELRAGFHNFGVITRYNRSILYALAVNDLGRRIESSLPPP